MGFDGEAAVSQELIQIIAAGIAGCGFAMMFHIRPKYLLLVLIGAGLSWFVYLQAKSLTGNRGMAMITAAMVVTIYSEILARVVKLPVSVIYTPTVVPLLPGSHLYYCMRGFVSDSYAEFTEYGNLLLIDTLGIVLGSLIVLTFVSAITSKRNRKNQ